ncbi:hypothetical protein [Gorillibacterium sp. sgz5001074]|uniref:hypothetical protein n=1 Tax=Gorillibacterium sp. sgz5001074 TaxID=3446695 RepID=UPI003F67CE54
MTIQFLDSRVSMHRNIGGGTEVLTEIPVMYGDIGLQTAAAVGTVNEGDVRVELWGTVGVTGLAPDSVIIYLQRGGSSVFGSGVIFFSAVYNLIDGPNITLISFHAADFPPALFVQNREIRYTMFVAATGPTPVTLTGPVTFSGLAQAGTTTS